MLTIFKAQPPVFHLPVFSVPGAMAQDGTKLTFRTGIGNTEKIR
jgi:hypothetical protein